MGGASRCERPLSGARPATIVTVRLRSLLALVWSGVTLLGQSPFRIKIVDRATGRGVPLVEVETTGGIRFVSDSAGIVAFDEPGLLGTKLWFEVRSHGYTMPADGFGFRGVTLDTRPGSKARIEIDRVNLAERLYRLDLDDPRLHRIGDEAPRPR